MTAPECSGCPFPDSVAALELMRLREGIGRLASEWESEAYLTSGDAGFNNGYDMRRESDANQLRALLDDNQGDS